MKQSMPLWKMILLLVGIIVFLYLSMAIFENSANDLLNIALLFFDAVLIYISAKSETDKQ